MFFLPKKKNKSFLTPDEVLFEALNKPNLDISKHEGQLEKPLTTKLSFFPLFGLLFLVIFFVGRIGHLQSSSERSLVRQAQINSSNSIVLVADRGVVTDRWGEPLIWNEQPEDAEHSERRYISKPGFAHLLGFISPPQKDAQGNYYRDTYEARSGVEFAYDEELRGQNGRFFIEQTARANAISGQKLSPAQAGESLTLSVDSRIQEVLHESIYSLAQSVGFEAGSGGIMNVKTGEIIALTNYPEYSRNFNDPEVDIETQEYSNLFTHGLFTPGSVVKPFVALAALNENIISPTKKILSTQTIVIPNPYNPSQPTYFSDWRAHGLVDVRDALAVSSNAYFYAVSGGLYDQPGMGISAMNEYMHAFGFGEEQAAAIHRFSPAAGVVPSPQWKEEMYEDGTWRLGDTFLSSIGQYDWQTTPLQMLRATAAIANRGTLLTPHLEMGRTSVAEAVPIDIKDNIYTIVHEGMREGVLRGTASGLNVPYVEIAAKTGTAELGRTKASVNSWVIGFWPYQDPQYAFVAMMSEGSRYNLTGATFVMRQTIDWMRDNAPEYFSNGN